MDRRISRSGRGFSPPLRRSSSKPGSMTLTIRTRHGWSPARPERRSGLWRRWGRSPGSVPGWTTALTPGWTRCGAGRPWLSAGSCTWCRMRCQIRKPFVPTSARSGGAALRAGRPGATAGSVRCAFGAGLPGSALHSGALQRAGCGDVRLGGPAHLHRRLGGLCERGGKVVRHDNLPRAGDGIRDADPAMCPASRGSVRAAKDAVGRGLAGGDGWDRVAGVERH